MDLISLQRILLTNHFEDFVKWAFPVVSSDSLVWGKHLDAICLHLQSVAENKIEQLLINLPPRHSKSIISTVIFPVWMWLRNPSTRLITASYSKKLSTEHALASRKLLESDQFKALFPHITLSDDSNAKDHYRNTRGGQRLAVSVGSSTTGFDADLIIVDDLHSVAERESEAELSAALDYFRVTLSSRAVPGKVVPKIVIGQRVHANDVSGYCLEQFDWTCLVLPLEYNPDAKPLLNEIGWKDWRKEKGEILWEEGFSRSRIAQIKKDHRHDFACLYNQDVESGSGDLFKKEWFRYWKDSDGAYLLENRSVRKSSCIRLAAVDLAVSTSDTADFTVCLVADCQGGDIIVRYMLRERLDGTKLVPKLKGVFETWKPLFLAVEQAGQQQIILDQLRRETVIVRTCKATESKETRSIPAQIKFESGQIWFPTGGIPELESELLSFPRGKHDDCVDALSWLVQQSLKHDRSEPEPDQDTLITKQQELKEQRFKSILWAGA